MGWDGGGEWGELRGEKGVVVLHVSLDVLERHVLVQVQPGNSLAMGVPIINLGVAVVFGLADRRNGGEWHSRRFWRHGPGWGETSETKAPLAAGGRGGGKVRHDEVACEGIRNKETL